MTGREVRVAVVGVGHLGRHHARIYASLPGCRLVGVSDTDPERAAAVASEYGTESLGDPATWSGEVDAVSVAVPTEAHRQVASPFLEAGKSVLVEKPIASTLEEADALVDLASRTGAILGVGHTERFNPAVEALMQRGGNPRFIECHRLGSFAPRSLDIDVVLDLMIHDIDITLTLVGAPVRSVEAIGVAALTPRADIANARVTFETGCVANLTASRISASKTRKIRVFQPDSYISCDCALRSVEHYRLESPPGSERPSIAHDPVEVPQDEPLRRELARFVSAVRKEEVFPVPGAAGRQALEVALTIVGKIRESMKGP